MRLLIQEARKYQSEVKENGGKKFIKITTFKEIGNWKKNNCPIKAKFDSL